MGFFVIFFTAYILGAVPFGYFFSKIYGKNILEIGWRKTSGSNVFKNVGILPGILTGICDILKGFLAVSLAKALNTNPQIQAIAGIFAVIGHNWSIFIKFAGGRGIATLIGAFLALSPEILILSIIFPLFLALFWNSSIATIIFLILLIYFSWETNQITTVGLLPTLSLFPIFIKRLSPIKELSLKNPQIIKNRLLFDNDSSNFKPRIKKIINVFTKK